MASITSLMGSSSTSSIYGNRNVLSGLASGMDTETMIENAVSGIKLKIQNLQKRRTKIEWQQEAYRSIIDKAVNFNQKYTSYTSKTNLLSSSFFNNAVITSTQGKYADKITATGKTSSDIKLQNVRQLAAAAAYTVSGLGGISGGDITSATSGTKFDISGTIPVSRASGTLTFQYGGTNGSTFDISFDELENLDEMEGASSAEKLANAINKKLSEISYTYTKNGVSETTTADKAIKATASGGKITFSDGLKNGNTITISSATGRLKSGFGISGSETKELNVGTAALMRNNTLTSYLADKDLGITFNGTTKNISMSNVLSKAGFSPNDGADAKNQKFRDALQNELDNAFGKDASGKSKIVVSKTDDGKLAFTPQKKGDVMSLGGSALKAMGFSSGDSNYLNTSKKLSELLGDKAESIFSRENRLRGVGYDVTQKKTASGDVYYLDMAGNRVDKDGFRVDSSGKALYDLNINGTSIAVTEDTTLESLMSSINSNADAGVKVSYSKLTNEFKFTATETGSNSKIEFGGLAKALFDPDPDPNLVINHNFADNYGFHLRDGQTNKITLHFDKFDIKFSVDNKMTMQDFAEKIVKGTGVNMYDAVYNEKTGQFSVTDKQTGKEVEFTITDQYDFDYKREIEPAVNGKYTKGQDAIMDVEVNGVLFEGLTRSSNTFDIDGLNITVKGTFETGKDEDPVTFSTTSDSDKIVEAIASMVNDYNEMVTEIKNAYSTQPAYKNKKTRYEPLSAEEAADYSETELAAYNEKAKQGILFGDSNLSSMYNKLLSAITPGGADGQTLREIGITTSYSGGLTTLTLDENKLRNALDSDPDKVKNAFTKTSEGSSSNGLMATMQNVLNTYVKTTGEPKGVLITHSGSIKAPTSLNSNTLNSQMSSIDNQIERWENKMADQIDRYTTKFSKLEQLIAEMNSQSSALMGLMGGNSGY